jgi:hypothetical protein
MIQQPPSSQEQKAVYEEIADALFASVPDDWTQINLFVSVESVDRPSLSISGANNEPLLKTPVDSLYPAIYRLIDIFKTSDRHFKGAKYRLVWDDSIEDWQMSVGIRW